MDIELSKKLTPSGTVGLQKIGEYFADAVLETASRIAQENGAGDNEISLRDIIEAKDEVLQNRLFPLRRRMLLLVTILLLAGLIYILTGLLLEPQEGWWEFFQNTAFNSNNIVIAMGMACIVVALILTTMELLRDTSSYQKIKGENLYHASDIDLLVLQISRIESLGRSLFQHEDNAGQNNTVNLSDIHRVIMSHLPDDDKKKMVNILNIRNEHIHGGLHSSDARLRKAVDDADDIISILELMK